MSTPAATVAQTTLDRIFMDFARREGERDWQIGALLTFPGPAPTVAEVVAHLAERLPHAPELTYRPTGAGRRAHWAADPDFDVARHVQVFDLPPGEGALADRMLTALLGRPPAADRPLWDVWVIRDDRGFGLCYRAHHAFQDGLAVARTVELLFGRQPRPAPTAPADPPPGPGAARRLAALRHVLPLPRRRARWSALDLPRSDRRAASTAETELPRLYAIGRATGAGVTQVCLAAATAVLREAYAADFPGPEDGVYASLGITARRPAEPFPRLGNRAAGATLPLPCGEPSAARRLQLVARDTAFARLAEMAQEDGALLRLPHRLAQRGMDRWLDARFVPLAVADVRTRGPLAFRGTPAAALHPLPIGSPRTRLFIAWTAYRGRLHVTFLGDAALPGLADLPDRWHRAVDALARAVP
ncbi:wax ester/triacylglycerol synthase domain-containing protein [Streptomyces johnsoniae]|uniref:Wax ester/triacylglycerol synthase family O-acyltransferase n=1 Tax=Streptomyces johnsoniae TaxID=3075532 RepID=A0ABU2RXM3_9ACTN|nr:wax ester/triacylglycerol synthase domain-containing protein [Streptomyces sp. DSM 41886]MDT0441492.1 wax ester/triacylglycerol synthase family O-acyltransferase [Streptomyces sp. DSM 41886]